mmetsp:Transcript_86132/g.240859  ORF Transcript_86132/g.240859 Transcript_86132/m.240859 type:complete len:405 (-) Transcript_86132:1395-2609(-)
MQVEIVARRNELLLLEVLGHSFGQCRGLRFARGFLLDAFRLYGNLGDLTISLPADNLALASVFGFRCLLVGIRIVVLRRRLAWITLLRLRHGVLVFRVLPEVSLQQVVQRSQDANEGIARDVQAFARPDSVDARLSRFAEQQSDLAEIISCGILHDLDFALVAHDACHSLALPHDEHLLVLLALLQDGLVVFELLFLENLSQCRLLVAGQHLEDVHSVQEFNVLLELHLRAPNDKVLEGQALKAPYLGDLVRSDRRGSRRVVKQSELAESKAGLCLEDLFGRIGSLPDIDVEMAALDDVEKITDSALLDGVFTLFDGLEEHRIDYFFECILGNVAEKHVQLAIARTLDNVGEVLPLFRRLRVDGRSPVVPGVLHGLCADALATSRRLPRLICFLLFRLLWWRWR